MVFMTLRRIVFQNIKNTFQFRNFVPFIVCLLPSLKNYRLNMTKILSRAGFKGIDVAKCIVFKVFVMTLRTSTRTSSLFTKKVN